MAEPAGSDRPPPLTMPDPILNGTLIRERRLSLGLSQPALARAIGVSSPVVDRIERGTNHDELNMRMVRQLAERLGLSMGGILAPPPCGSSAGEVDVKLEAALSLVSRRISLSGVARALDLDLPTAQAAIEALRERLAPSGRRVIYSGGKVQINPSVDRLAPDEVQRVERESMNEVRISVSQARVLRDLVQGRVDRYWKSEASSTQRNSLVTLIRLGWVEDDGQLAQPGPEVRYSLNLDGERRRAERAPSDPGQTSNADRRRPRAREEAAVMEGESADP